MTLINRRMALRGIASIPVLGGATAALAGGGSIVPAGVCVAPAATAADAGLFSLLKDYEAASADLAKAKSDLEWIVAEWRHLWPLAPEELLGGGNAHLYMSPGFTAERDIAGNFMMRDVSTLTKRLTSKQRREGGENCFTLTTSALSTERLEYWRTEVPKGRTAKRLARNRKFRLDMIRRFEREHAMALAYEAETTRLRQVSGANAAIDRFNAAEDACYDLSEVIMRHPAATTGGIAAKVDLFLTLPRVRKMFDVTPDWGHGKAAGLLAFGWYLSHDVQRIRGQGAVQS